MSTRAVQKQLGISLIELLLSVAIAAMVMTGIASAISHALTRAEDVQAKNEINRQARFAMQRMVSAVQGTRRLMLPLSDNPATDWRENVREQTLPASPPEGSSTLATAVLAVTLDPRVDRDQDGWADANNDKDYLDLNNNGLRDKGEPERIDEDLGEDNSNDDAHGIIGIDDNGDGTADGAGRYVPADNKTLWVDNDESSLTQPPSETDEQDDYLNGVDDDGDGSIDEDIHADMNLDGAPGLLGVDDDEDGLVDEAGGGGSQNDDDEDGLKNEDWLDPVVFYLVGSTLVERQPSLIDTNGDTLVSGADYRESVIAEHVTLFRVERLAVIGGRTPLVELTLQLTSPDGHVAVLSSRVRAGGDR